MAIRCGTLEALGMSRLPDPSVWRGRRVAVTGHTGFKGSWLCQWLVAMGAEVHGLSDHDPRDGTAVPHVPMPVGLAGELRADVADVDAVSAWLRSVVPSVVVHLAAQPLVGVSYREPWRTLSSNVLGTASVLDSIIGLSGVEAVLIITSDKVYDPAGGRALVEEDRLGLGDPYSASKALAERVVDLYAELLQTRGGTIAACRLATARAGNVLGGGDWSEGRVMPDYARAALTGEPLLLRAPEAIRPWQHVLDPLCGYLLLCENLLAGRMEGSRSAFNFGPGDSGTATVRELVARLDALWPGAVKAALDEETRITETRTLRLDSRKARERLGWEPRWDLDEALHRTVVWYRAAIEGVDTQELTLGQIEEYLRHG